MKTVYLFFLIAIGFGFSANAAGVTNNQDNEFFINQLFFQKLKISEPKGKTNQELILKWYNTYEDNEKSRKGLLEGWKLISSGDDLKMIYEECEKNDVPFVEKVFVTLIESGWRNVVSKSGAVGRWQFMEKTARAYGLRVDKEVDERLDKEKSTKAAIYYERYLFNTISKWAQDSALEVTYANKWHFAEAAYNWGIGNMKAVFFQTKGDFSKYPNVVNDDEAREYVPRIFAARRWLSDYLVSQGEIKPPVISQGEIKSSAQFSFKMYLKFKDQMGSWDRDVQLRAIRGMFLAEGHSKEYLDEALTRIARERKALNYNK